MKILNIRNVRGALYLEFCDCLCLGTTNVILIVSRRRDSFRKFVFFPTTSVDLGVLTALED